MDEEEVEDASFVKAEARSSKEKSDVDDGVKESAER